MAEERAGNLERAADTVQSADDRQAGKRQRRERAAVWLKIVSVSTGSPGVRLPMETPESTTPPGRGPRLVPLTERELAADDLRPFPPASGSCLLSTLIVPGSAKVVPVTVTLFSFSVCLPSIVTLPWLRPALLILLAPLISMVPRSRGR